MEILLGVMTLVCCLCTVAFSADYGNVTSTKVADGVYLFQTTRYGDVGFGGNAVAILGDDGVVMFDSGGTPAAAQTILAELRRLTDKPVLYVINSHWHWDHWGGNQVFKAAFPSLQILSHDKNLEQMRDVAIPWNAPGLEKDLPEYIAYQKKQLAAAEGKHAPEAELARRRELLAADENFLEQKRSVTYTLPNVTFSESITLYLGKREIRVLHARAITPGDTYIYLPKEKLLISGDILVHPVPFAVGGTFPADWIETLRKLDAMDVDVIVPGHGDVERGKAYLQQSLKLFQHVLADVKDAKDKGVTFEEIKKKLDENANTYAADLNLPESMLPTFRSYFLGVFVNRVYHELEKPLGDSPKS